MFDPEAGPEFVPHTVDIAIEVPRLQCGKCLSDLLYSAGPDGATIRYRHDSFIKCENEDRHWLLPIEKSRKFGLIRTKPPWSA